MIVSKLITPHRPHLQTLRGKASTHGFWENTYIQSLTWLNNKHSHKNYVLPTKNEFNSWSLHLFIYCNLHIQYLFCARHQSWTLVSLLQKTECRALFFFFFFTILKPWLGMKGSTFSFLLSGFGLFLNTKGYVIFSMVEVSTVLLLFSETTERSTVT